MNYVFLNGKPVEHPHETHHHVSPVWLYLAVFGALLVLTGVTYAVSFAGLGSASLPVAMVVATIKATLVVAFFMHLLYEDRLYLFAFIVAVLLVGLFFGFVLFDSAQSGSLNDESKIGGQRRDEGPKKLREAEHHGATHGAGEGHGATGDGHAAEGEHGEGEHAPAKKAKAKPTKTDAAEGEHATPAGGH